MKRSTTLVLCSSVLAVGFVIGMTADGWLQLSPVRASSLSLSDADRLFDELDGDTGSLEAGKKAANQVLALQAALLAKLDATPRSAAEVAAELPDADPDWVWELCRHLAATRDGVRQTGAADRASARFSMG